MSLGELRERAERQLGARAKHLGVRSEDLATVVRELDICKLMLEMQDEQLRSVQGELARSRKAYFELFELAPGGYLTLSAGGTILEANPSAARLFGVERLRLVGKRLTDFMSEHDADLFHMYQHHVFSSGARHPCELEFRGEDGRAFTARLDALPCAEQGDSCRAAINDVSELRHAEQSLHIEAARTRSLLDTAPDAVVGLDVDGCIDTFNPAAERMFGWTEREIRGRLLSELIPPEDLEAAAGVASPMPAMAGKLGARAPQRAARETPGTTLTGIRKGGERFPLELSIGEWHAGPDRKFIGILRDVSERSRFERELSRAGEMEAVGTLACGVAHDFRNLLQVIIGFIRLAVHDTSISRQARAYLERAADAAERGANLTDQLLTFSRHRSTRTEPLDLDATLLAASGLFERLLGDGVRLAVNTGAPGATVEADPIELDQIFMNLVTNARDAMTEGGSLTITTRPVTITPGDDDCAARPGRYVCIDVHDDGAGMDEATLAHIFEPFFTTKGTGRGTGLGLAMVVTIVERMGGFVDVESKPGDGTTFSLCLPCTDARPVSSRPAPACSTTMRGRILLAEDDPMVRHTLRKDLEALGFEVVEAESPERAVELGNERGGIDALVSDVMMPGLTGPELAARLRQDHPELPVLFLSAYTADELLERGAVDAEAALLQKPVRKEALASWLARLMPSSVSPRDSRHDTA